MFEMSTRYPLEERHLYETSAELYEMYVGIFGVRQSHIRGLRTVYGDFTKTLRARKNIVTFFSTFLNFGLVICKNYEVLQKVLYELVFTL